MLEVVPGLLLGSMGDALAVMSRVPSVTKQYTVTHILTIANDPLDWSDYDQSESLASTDKNKTHGGDGGGGLCEPGDPVKRGDVLCEPGDPVKSGDVTGQDSVPGDPVKVEDVMCEASDPGDPVQGEGVMSDPEMGEGVKEVDSTVTLGRFKTKFVCLADMPKSDLLHHFEPCCRFIQEGVARGTVLVHCVHGISRSVTVVLAYQMWSEGRPFQVLFDSLKERKPEIRPNHGFIEQLKLWGAMRCRLDNNNKLYKAYRLKTVAREMKESGYVEKLTTSPDPFANSIDSTAYYRCRKCRRLLFTDDSVLPHELGEGQSAFKWNKRSKPGSPHADIKGISNHKQSTMTNVHSPTHVEQAAPKCNDTIPSTDDSSSNSAEEKMESTNKPGSIEGSLLNEQDSPHSPPHTDITPEGLAKVRAQVATVMSLSRPSTSDSCSSYFVEPMEWMESALLGRVEGKIQCPKCSARLGSFNWSGDQCSCGQWVTPSFQIHRSKVDETRTLTKRKIASTKS